MVSRVEQFRKAVEQDPESEVAQFGLGRAFFTEKQYEEAASTFQKVIEIKPDYTAAFLQLGKSLERAGRKDEARQIYKKGIHIGEKKGDLEPTREMEHRLMKLDWKPPGE